MILRFSFDAFVIKTNFIAFDIISVRFDAPCLSIQVCRIHKVITRNSQPLAKKQLVNCCLESFHFLSNVVLDNALVIISLSPAQYCSYFTVDIGNVGNQIYNIERVPQLGFAIKFIGKLFKLTSAWMSRTEY